MTARKLHVTVAYCWRCCWRRTEIQKCIQSCYLQFDWNKVRRKKKKWRKSNSKISFMLLPVVQLWCSAFPSLHSFQELISSLKKADALYSRFKNLSFLLLLLSLLSLHVRSLFLISFLSLSFLSIWNSTSCRISWEMCHP